jgi:lysyl-tRNA synthetase class 1
LQKNIKQAIDFEPEGDTIPVLFDTYDRLAEKYFAGVLDDQSRLFKLVHLPEEQSHIRERFLPRFSMVAFLVQMPHLNFLEEIEALKGSPLTSDDRIEAEMRATYAKQWLTQYAAEQYKFELKTRAVPEAATHFSNEQKGALREVLAFFEQYEHPTGEELHAALHATKEKSGLTPQQFFGALYQAFLGKDSGPKAGWFLSVLPRDFLLRRLKEVS